MSKTPTLTAIVSLYNSGTWLHNRIDNLMKTSLYHRGQLLIFCVNAQSPDVNDDIIANSFSGRANFHYEVVPYMTVYGAWNHAIRKTDSEFITNANADDLVSPDCYETLISACVQSNAALAYCGWYSVHQSNMKWEQISGFWNHVAYYNPLANQHSCGHMPVWRRSIHSQIGLFDPSFKALGDADLWFRCWMNNIRSFAPIDLPLGAYLWRNGENLWHKTDEGTRAKEWKIIANRQPGKLDF